MKNLHPFARSFSKAEKSVLTVLFVLLLSFPVFINRAEAQTIASFAPASGAIGSSVSIIGTGFNATANQNIVFFGATMATVTAASITVLTVTVPTGATYQKISVTNLANHLTAYSLKPFIVTYSNGSIAYATKTDFSTTGSATGMAVGDLDGDGKADLAVADNNGVVSVFRNTSTSGTISYAAKVDFATGTYPRYVVIGDMDGDGKLDLAVANQGSTSVSVLRNTSSGTGNINFAAKVDMTTGSSPSSVAIGDMDGDGKLDLVVQNNSSTFISIFRNTSLSGSISYIAKQDFTLPNNGVALAIGDFDGDGKPDFAATNGTTPTGLVSVFRNTSSSGSITFAAKVDISTGANPYGIAIGDLDGDGKDDMALVSGGLLSVFRNTSTGTANIGFADKIDLTAGIGPIRLAIGDLDGDGKPDLAVQNGSSTFVSAFRNTSTSGSISYETKTDFPVVTNSWGIAIGDIDGDGKSDLAVGIFSSGSNVSVLRNVTYTTEVTATTGTYGPTLYYSLKAAFDAINAGVHKGDITVKIIANSIETASAVLNANGSGSASYSYVNIYPTATGLSISGDLAGSLIDLNGADNVTIDGRVNATGSTKNLVVSNTSTSNTAGTSTIRFKNDASTNTVKYCTIKGSETDGSSGIILFSAGNTSGNNNNTIDHNDITCASDANRPYSAIYSQGLSGTILNSSNSITNNNIYNFFRRDVSSNGILLGPNTAEFTISGNSFYETASFAATVSVGYFVIYINAASGGTISNNYIGGSTANCGGTAWTKTNAYDNNIFAMYLHGTGTVSVQGNTIANFNFANSGSSGFFGIGCQGGNANIGTITGNTIGAATGTGSIVLTNAGGDVYFRGIYNNSPGARDIRNNTIGSITLNNSASLNSNFYGIYTYGDESTNTTIINNTIGSTTTANSINATSTSGSTEQDVYGIYTGGAGTKTISGNTIANLKNGTTNATTTTVGRINGIYSYLGTNTISNNTVRDLTIANQNWASDATASIIGIVLNSITATAQTVSGNTISNLSNTRADFIGYAYGLYYSGPATASTVSGNFIHSLALSSNAASIYGMRIKDGTTTYSNNIISIGDNRTTHFVGIWEDGGNNNMYFNTVYIGGSPTTGTQQSQGMLSNGSGSRIIANNLFINARSNSGSASGSHYAIYISYKTSLTTNYNDYYASGTGKVLGYYYDGNKTTIEAWRTASAQDNNSVSTNPSFASAGGTTAVNYLPTVNTLNAVTGTGITTDYAGTARTTPKMGAYETYPVPTITSFAPASGPAGTLVTITGTNLSSPTAFTIGGTTAIVVSNTGTNLVGMVMPGAATGAVFVTTAGGIVSGSGNFTVTATPFPGAQQGDKLVGTGGTANPTQGSSVAVSADGNTALVGGYADNSNIGAAWVYTRTDGVWSQQGNKLVGTGGDKGIGEGVFQGRSVALSADGNTALVGGYGDNNYVGAAWVYTRSAGTWTQQGDKLVGAGVAGKASQGYSVSLSADGNTALIGGYSEGGSYTGAAWVFTRSGTTWTQQGNKLVGTGTYSFGSSVSLSADGNTALIGEGSPIQVNIGSAWVYTRSAGTWTQQGDKLVGTGATGKANQGNSVSLSADGNTAIVGGAADNSSAGAVWVYTRSGTTWTQQGNKLVGTGATGPWTGQGVSVSLSADGNTAIVGGTSDNIVESVVTGASWVFTRSAGTWSQQGSKLVGTGAIDGAYQGNAVSLSADGSTAAVGGWWDNSAVGAAWVFTPSTCTAPAISSQSTATQTQCLNGTFMAITVTATGTELTYQWYSNTTASASGGTSLVATNGAQTNSYTPQAGTAGTLYYYCIVTGTCGTATSSVSGAFIVNAPSFTATVRHVSDLTATGENIKWYAAASGGTALLSTDVLPNGTSNYYASQTVNDVESTARFHVVVTVDPTPCAPGGSAAQTKTPGQTLANLSITGSNIRWYSAASGGSLLNPSTVLVNGTHYWATQTINCTESATRLEVTVTVN
jgi:FG-GAP-like repeat/FG-GAP repeat